MPNPAFIVEGTCEQRAVQRICPGKRVVTLGTNGVTVSMAAIAKRVVAIYKQFSNRHFPIVVLFDREGRTSTREDMLSELEQHISTFGIDPRQFVFGIPDRKIENWMLPFVIPAFGAVDGESAIVFKEESADIGKIQQMLSARGRRYHKTTIGSDLILNIEPEQLRRISRSFDDFYSQLESFCDWGRQA